MSIKSVITGFICICTTFAWLGLAHAESPAGKVIVSKGDVNVHASPAKSLKRGDKVYSGQTITTGDQSFAQLRFSDSTLLSIDANSEYKIDHYQYHADDASQDAQTATLLKGSLSTVTGKIAKKNPKLFKTKTPVATIGVRSTSFSLSLKTIGNDLVLFLNVLEGTACVYGTQICFGPNQKHSNARITSQGVQSIDFNSDDKEEVLGGANMHVPGDIRGLERGIRPAEPSAPGRQPGTVRDNVNSTIRPVP